MQVITSGYSERCLADLCCVDCEAVFKTEKSTATLAVGYNSALFFSLPFPFLRSLCALLFDLSVKVHIILVGSAIFWDLNIKTSYRFLSQWRTKHILDPGAFGPDPKQ
jgi:hypothetical protein